MLRKAVLEDTGPVAVRYPRGGEGLFLDDTSGKAAETVYFHGGAVTMVSYGTEINEVMAAARMLRSGGVEPEVIKLNVLSPLDAEPVLASVRRTGALLVAEEVCAAGCVGERLLAAAEQAGVRLRAARLVNLGGGVVEHGDPRALLVKTGLDNGSLCEAVLEMLHGKDKA